MTESERNAKSSRSDSSVEPLAVARLGVVEEDDVLERGLRVPRLELGDGDPEMRRERLALQEAKIAEDVVNAAYSIIQGKGATNYAVGLAGTRVLEAILRASRGHGGNGSFGDDCTVMLLRRRLNYDFV